MASWSLSPLATAELNDILEYFEREGGSRAIADRMLIEFMACFDKLADHPLMGAMQPGSDSCRRWYIRQYMVLYEPSPSGMRIVRIIHGARDITGLLDEEP